MRHLHLRSVRFRLGLAAAALVLAAAAGAQTTAIGLSTVRAQRFGNENLLGFYTPQAGDLFAYALATGDFNGDGAADLATGIPYDNGIAGSETNDSGTVIVRYGSPGAGLATNLASTVLRRTPASHPGDNYGYALAACDFNGDGIADLAVGAPYEDYLGHPDSGTVQIHYGSTSGIHTYGDAFYAQSTPGIPGDVEDSDWFGYSLACGDFNGDGFADLVVGIPHENLDIGFSYQEGRVVIIPGSAAGLDPSATRELDQNTDGMAGTAENGDFFGEALAVGDFNGDGFADLAIGVPNENDTGAIQVVFGGPSGLTSAGNVLWTETDIGGLSEKYDQFGYTLAAGDFDGDGFADLAIGVPYEDLGSGNAIKDAGQVNVLYGAPGGFDRGRTQFWDQDTIFGAGTNEANDHFGLSLAAGDFDKDGRADLAIGHPNEGVSGSNDGAVSILMGSATGLTTARHRQIVEGVEGFPGDVNQHEKGFGYALACGDFDGDGHADLAAGAPWENENGIADVGAEVVLYGAVFGDGFENGSTTLWSQNVSSLYFNKVHATTAAKLGPLSSKLGLQVDLFNPTIQRPATATYVRVGPEAGFNNERTLKGSFFIDPQSLTMSPNAGFNVFQMVAFTDALGTGSKTRLAFDLTRSTTTWSIIANSFNDSINGLQFAGSGALAAVGDANGHNIRIDYEWTAGNPGHLTMWRTRFVGGVPDSSGTVQLFSVDLPGMGSAVVNDVLAGMVTGQRSGTYGSFYLDEFSFRR